jgi:pimeloyl-ACP methyl ester carboxylesterase
LQLQVGAGDVPEGADPIEEPEALSRVDAPALIAVGEHDKPDFHLAAELLAGTFPNGRLRVMPGAGHFAPLEQPQAFRELLLSFLA